MDVVFCGGKSNLVNESRAVGRGLTGDPFQNITAAGVVIRQGIRHGVVGLLVTLQQLFQIPGPGESISDGMKTLLVRERPNMFRIRPFLRRLFAKLHQANLARPPACLRIEAAFAPHDRFDQRRFHPVPLSRHTNGPILTLFQPPFPQAV